VIVETVAEDFLIVMKNRGSSIAHDLRRLQNLAVDLGWLAWPGLAKAAWPRFLTGTAWRLAGGKSTRLGELETTGLLSAVEWTEGDIFYTTESTAIYRWKAGQITEFCRGAC
jgi:hypothetical protein